MTSPQYDQVSPCTPSPQKNPWFRPIYMCSLASIFYIYEFLIRVMPSAMSQELMSAYHIQSGALGAMASFFFYGYAPMQIPVGVLYDKFGTRRLLVMAMFICAIATLAIGVSPTYTVACISWFLIGFTSAFSFIGAMLIASQWLPQRHFALFTGALQMLGCVGAIAGQIPVAKLTTELGWQQTTLIIAIGGFIFTLITFLFLKENPKAVERRISNNQTQQSMRLKKVCQKSQTWWIGLSAFCTWTPVTIVASLWGIPFFMSMYHMNSIQASQLIAWVWIGIGIGSPLIGWWSNHIHNRRIPLLCCAWVGLISILLALYVPMGYWQIALVLFWFGVAASGQAVTFGLVMDINEPEVLGTAVGFNNMAVVVGGVFLQPLVGYVLQWYEKTPLVVNDAPIYGIAAYQLALIVVPICYVIGLIVNYLFIKETHCRMAHPSRQSN